MLIVLNSIYPSKPPHQCGPTQLTPVPLRGQRGKRTFSPALSQERLKRGEAPGAKAHLTPRSWILRPTLL